MYGGYASLRTPSSFQMVILSSPAFVEFSRLCVKLIVPLPALCHLLGRPCGGVGCQSKIFNEDFCLSSLAAKMGKNLRQDGSTDVGSPSPNDYWLAVIQFLE